MSGWYGASRGPKGERGDDGVGTPGAPGTSATVSVGTVTTGAPGSPASITNAGTANAAVLNFSIPRGDKGDKGDPGTPSKLVHSITASTNAAGVYTWTFPTPFAAVPRVVACVQSATTDIFDVKVTAVSTTSCTVQIGRTQASVVALLGLTILSVPSSVGAQTVNIIACAP